MGHLGKNFPRDLISVNMIATKAAAIAHQTFQVPKMEVLTYISCMDTAYVRENPLPNWPNIRFRKPSILGTWNSWWIAIFFLKLQPFEGSLWSGCDHARRRENLEKTGVGFWRGKSDKGIRGASSPKRQKIPCFLYVCSRYVQITYRYQIRHHGQTTWKKHMST